MRGSNSIADKIIAHQHALYHLRLSAISQSLVPGHGQIICLRQKRLYVRCKRLVAGVEHADPEEAAIHRMGHDLIQGSEVVAARVCAAGRYAVFVGRERGRAEECSERLLADADIQAKDRWAVEVGELVVA